MIENGLKLNMTTLSSKNLNVTFQIIGGREIKGIGRNNWDVRNYKGGQVWWQFTSTNNEEGWDRPVRE